MDVPGSDAYVYARWFKPESKNDSEILMDIPKKTTTRRWPIVRIAGVLILAGSFTIAYARFNAFSSTVFVERDELVISDVVRSDLVREVRAPGNLVPAELRWVAATSNSRVENIILDPGDSVNEDSIVMTLSNPDLEQLLDSVKLELDVLEAEYQALEQRLNNDLLTQESQIAEVESLYELADFRKNANQKLSEDRAVSEISLNQSILEEKALAIRFEIELRRLESLKRLHEAELVAKRARINQSVRVLELQQKLFDELQVRAEFSGHLQDIPVEQGQQLSKGTILARVADNKNLKTELRVQESQVKDVRPGQTVVISAGGNSAKGIVRRVEPEVQEGVVIVDVYFDDELLIGARSDLRVDGVIQLERLSDVLKLKRPVFSQENAAVNLFVLDQTGETATRKLVRIGKTSTDEIQVVDGLAEGDRVIVSDTSKFNQFDQFTLR